MAFKTISISFFFNLIGWTFYSHKRYHGIDDQDLTVELPSCSATALFSLGVCTLLLQAELYPRSLKKLPKVAAFFYEVIMGMLLLEISQIGFWYPLDGALRTLLLSDYFEDSCFWCGTMILPCLTNLIAAIFLYTTLWATESFCNIARWWRQEKSEECPCACHAPSTSPSTSEIDLQSFSSK